jgi:hypothetical protein
MTREGRGFPGVTPALRSVLDADSALGPEMALA